jgi:hypothetical protein
VKFQWREAREIRRVEIAFDTDFDHPLESVLMGHPEREIPFCIKRFRVSACDRPLFEVENNHSTRVVLTLDKTLKTDSVEIEILETRGMPAAIFEVRCYED